MVTPTEKLKVQLDEFAKVFADRAYTGIFEVCGHRGYTLQCALLGYAEALLGWREGKPIPKSGISSERYWVDGLRSFVFCSFEFTHSVQHGFSVNRFTAFHVTTGGKLLKKKSSVIRSPKDLPTKQQAFADVVLAQPKRRRLRNGR